VSEIEDKVNRIRKSFASETADENDTIEMSFLDEVNGLIHAIFKDEPMDVYTALTPGELEKWKNQKWRRRWARIRESADTKALLYLTLLLTITGFLVSEAVAFYGHGDVITAKTWMKAILTEVAFIFLSGYRSEGTAQKIGVGALRVSIFILMMFVITSEVAMQGTGTVAEIDNIQAQIEVVEKEIADTDKLIAFYLKKDWPIRVSILQDKKAKLVKKLLELKERQNDGKSVEVSALVQYKLLAKAAFRIILLFISVLITRRLFKF
jgi:hypothetical protein